MTDSRPTPVPPPMRLSGLEPVAIGKQSLFVNIGERTNVTGSKAFARMILEGRFDEADHMLDEAHRWANGYHQLLMKRRIAESTLDDCPGVSEARPCASMRNVPSPR